MFPFRKSSQPRVISVHSYYLTSSLDLAFCKLNEPHSTYSFLDFMYFTHHLPQIFFCIFRFGGSSCEIPFENCSFVLFSHHGLPSFSVFVSCFGFLGWNCRFPKSVPFASLNFSGAFGKSFMDGFFFFFEFPEMKTFLFARYFTTMHRFFFLRISGIAFCIGFFLVTICYHKLFAVSSRNIV